MKTNLELHRIYLQEDSNPQPFGSKVWSAYPCSNKKNHESRISGSRTFKFAVQAGCQGFDSHWQHMSKQFFQSNRPGYLSPVCSELGKMVSEWQPVIAVSLNIRDDIRLIKLAKLYTVDSRYLDLGYLE